MAPHKRVAAPKVAFESGGQFIRETRREVEAYLADGRTRRWGYARLYAKAPLALGLIAVSWALLLFVPHTLVVAIPVWQPWCSARC